MYHNCTLYCNECPLMWVAVLLVLHNKVQHDLLQEEKGALYTFYPNYVFWSVHSNTSECKRNMEESEKHQSLDMPLEHLYDADNSLLMNLNTVIERERQSTAPARKPHRWVFDVLVPQSIPWEHLSQPPKLQFMTLCLPSNSKVASRVAEETTRK